MGRREAGCLLLSAGLGLSAASCDQPRPKCSVARGQFAAVYQLIGGTGDCAQLHGELFNVQPYAARGAGSDNLPNYDKVSIGIEPQSLTDLRFAAAELAVEPNPEDHPYALGAFGQAEPEQDFCAAPALTVARLRLPEIPAQLEMCPIVPAQPAVDVQYEFSNVRVYTTPAAYGTQFAADLVYTKDGCTAQYEVRAVYPAVPCAAASPSQDESPASGDGGLEDAGTVDAAGGLDAAADLDAQTEQDASADDAAEEADGACPEPEPEAPAEPTPPDETLCSPYADPAQGRAYGSAINPEFAIVCDPDLLLCVLAKEVPSLR